MLFRSDFAHHLANAMKAYTPASMLHAGIQAAYLKNSTAAMEQKGVCLYTDKNPDAENAYPVLATVDGASFLANPLLSEEVFGPYSLVVQCADMQEMLAVAKQVHGQLTATCMATESEAAANSVLIQQIEQLCGRIIFNGVPTGVEVCLSMQHGGPFPASTDSRFGSVGADGIKRFSRPIAYQNWPDALLPEALQQIGRAHV